MKKILQILLILFLAACSQNMKNEGTPQDSGQLLNLTRQEFLSIAFNAPKELDESEVKTIAENFLNALIDEEKAEGALARSISSDFTLEFGSKTYFTTAATAIRTGEQILLPVYEIKITSEQGKGVIYVSADERNAEVITYIPVVAQNDKVSINSGSAFLLKWAKTTSYERLVEIEGFRQELHDATVAKISKALNIRESKVTIENIIDEITVEGVRATPVDAPATQIVTMKVPLVKVEWDQSTPYNLSLQAPDSPSTQAHVYTGCAVTAACQLMTAIKPNLTLGGTVIDWNYLSETPTISSSAPQRKLDMLGKLHTWVFNQLEAVPQYDVYGYHNGTGVSINTQKRFYGNYFNHSENDVSYDPDALLRSFNADYPSLIRGQGYAWIMDGYIIANKKYSTANPMSRSMIVQYYDLFWHANLGWGGPANGYYKLKLDTHVKFETFGGYVFTTEGLSIYPGLYKKTTSFSF